MKIIKKMNYVDYKKLYGMKEEKVKISVIISKRPLCKKSLSSVNI